MNRHFSEAEVAEALAALEAGVRVPEVCRRVGVSELTLTRWRRRAGLLPARRTAPVPAPTPALDPEQAAHRIAGLEQRLEALREVLVAMLEPTELERAARVLEARLSVSAKGARRMLGLPHAGAPSDAAAVRATGS